MYWYEYVVLSTFGLAALIEVCRLIWSIRFEKQPFTFWDFLAMAVCGLVLGITFLGIK